MNDKMYKLLKIFLISAKCSEPQIQGATLSTSGDINHGASTKVTCQPGFTIEGGSTMTCSDGKFDQTPTCKGNAKILL